ncbi:MAG: hypothetical protein K5662_00075 [Lachnospiraceae bacterium]|nr:hypothetical protein [Lachnospiraceae bacterium]
MNEEYNNLKPIENDERLAGDRLAHIASILGLAALVTLVFIPYLPLCLAGTAVIMACISRGSRPSFPNRAVYALMSGVGIIILHVVLIGGLLLVFYTDNPVKKRFNDVLIEEIGHSMEELMEDAGDGKFDLEYKVDPETFLGYN